MQKFRVFFLILLVGNFACNEKPVTNRPQVPSATILATTTGLNLTVTVEVPPNHHAYLDTGDEDSFIPISFGWQFFINDKQLTRNPTMLQKPEGIRETELKVNVLRGKGIYKFELEKDAKLKGLTLKVRSQICDDVSGVCYRPSMSKTTIN